MLNDPEVILPILPMHNPFIVSQHLSSLLPFPSHTQAILFNPFPPPPPAGQLAYCTQAHSPHSVEPSKQREPCTNRRRGSSIKSKNISDAPPSCIASTVHQQDRSKRHRYSAPFFVMGSRFSSCPARSIAHAGSRAKFLLRFLSSVTSLLITNTN